MGLNSEPVLINGKLDVQFQRTAMPVSTNLFISTLRLLYSRRKRSPVSVGWEEKLIPE
jgi:hypothetical protein